MKDYKIRVKDEAESRESQELFFELGYTWLSGRTTTDNEKSPYLYTSEDFGLWCGDYHSTFNECVRKELTLPQLRDLVVKHRKQTGLISGADALANVHENIVQYFHDDEPYGRWTTITDHLWSQYHLGMFLDADTKFKFRLKPQTIKVELEIPKPFVPEEFEDCFMLSDLYKHGYVKTSWKYDKSVPAWRTEEEIKQVVEQLRKIGGMV